MEKKSNHKPDSVHQLIVDAITLVGAPKKGASFQAINKCILGQNSDRDPARLKISIKKAMRKGIDDGDFIRAQSSRNTNGVVGSFLLAKSTNKEKAPKKLLTKVDKLRNDKPDPGISPIVAADQTKPKVQKKDKATTKAAQLEPIEPSHSTVLEDDKLGKKKKAQKKTTKVVAVKLYKPAPIAEPSKKRTVKNVKANKAHKVDSDSDADEEAETEIKKVGAKLPKSKVGMAGTKPKLRAPAKDAAETTANKAIEPKTKPKRVAKPVGKQQPADGNSTEATTNVITTKKAAVKAIAKLVEEKAGSSTAKFLDPDEVFLSEAEKENTPMNFTIKHKAKGKKLFNHLRKDLSDSEIETTPKRPHQRFKHYSSDTEL